MKKNLNILLNPNLQPSWDHEFRLTLGCGKLLGYAACRSVAVLCLSAAP
jgi:hypothetical protein